MNAFLWSAVKPVIVTAVLAALVILASRPRARRALWSLRLALARNTPAWGGTDSGTATLSGSGAWDETYWHKGVDPLRDAPAREMGPGLDEGEEDDLAELAAHTWPRSEYMEIVRYETRVWRRAARALRRRTGVAS